jgi:prevent-host-death family protein
MFNLTDIHPLTAFLRDHKAHLERLEETGRPEVLTVNGKPKVVVQDVAAYQQMMELLDSAKSAIMLAERLIDVEQGKTKLIPAADAIAELRRRNAARKKRSA